MIGFGEHTQKTLSPWYTQTLADMKSKKLLAPDRVTFLHDAAAAKAVELTTLPTLQTEIAETLYEELINIFGESVLSSPTFDVLMAVDQSRQRTRLGL